MYCYSNKEIVISEDKFNSIKGTNFKVDKRQYIDLYQNEELSCDKEYINNNTKLEILLKNNIYELQRSEYVFKYIFRSDNYSLNRVKILNKSDYEYIKEKSSDYEIGKELLPIFFIGPIIGCALVFVYSVISKFSGFYYN